MHLIKTLAFFVLALLTLHCFSDNSAKFDYGKISKDDFNKHPPASDSSADALVLADIGSTEFTAANSGGLNLLFKRQLRILILNRKGFDAAEFHIQLYSSGSADEVLRDLDAATYTLENGEIVKHKLSSGEIFKTKLDRNHQEKKFTLPNLQVGCIIEVSYEITSDFIFNLRSWDFQGPYPKLWTEYTVSIPEFYKYVFLSQGYLKFENHESTSVKKIINFMANNGARSSEQYALPCYIYTDHWTMKDVPSFKEESFITTSQNYISRIEFQLSKIDQPGRETEDVLGSYKSFSNALMNDKDFGGTVLKQNKWMDDEMNAIRSLNDSRLLQATSIYNFIRDNFHSTGENGIYLESNLKQIFTDRKGSDAEINLLLTAMLHHEGFAAQPVILSTRSHGFTNELYPVAKKFNHVICRLQIEGKTYNLDASDPIMGFGHLDSECYNGHARGISEDSQPVYLEADSIRERSITNALVSVKDGKVTGQVSTLLGYSNSTGLRRMIRNVGKDEFVKKTQTNYGVDFKLEDIVLDSLNNPDYSVTLKYNLSADMFNDDIVYFNPMLGEGHKENELKSATRLYPVEIPYLIDQTYLLTFQVPPGYKVEELPASVQVKLKENDGIFEYIFKAEESTIQLKSKLKLNRANFPAEDYENLRELFAIVVKKHAEQIVFKKVK